MVGAEGAVEGAADGAAESIDEDMEDGMALRIEGCKCSKQRRHDFERSNSLTQVCYSFAFGCEKKQCFQDAYYSTVTWMR
jgi:hypothetical protein